MKFTPSPDADRLLRESLQAELRKVGDDIAEGAALFAPMGDPGRRPAFDNKHSYRSTTEPNGQVVVGSDDPNGHIVEFGSVTSIEYAPMRRAIRALGYQLNDLGKTAGASGRRRTSAGRKPRKGA